MTKNKNKKSSEAAKQEAFKLSDGICYCKTPDPGEALITGERITVLLLCAAGGMLGGMLG